ncbi:MAG: zinc ribbon domain-containing protein, partial [Polyangiaceae bacterium]
MICDVCGRDNAERLTFCQDCGRRLQGRSQRVAAPTPPAGLDKIELPTAPATGAMSPGAASGAAMALPSIGAAPAAARSAPASARLGTPAPRHRPEAPAFTFAPGSLGPVAREPTAPPAPAGSPQMAPGTCGSCGGGNPPGYRFCVTCGAPLAPSAAPRALAAPMPADHAPPTAAALARPGEDKIVGSPVVDIAATRQTPVRLVTCPRCNGQCTLGTRFCKYCGASL